MATWKKLPDGTHINLDNIAYAYDAAAGCLVHFIGSVEKKRTLDTTVEALLSGQDVRLVK